MTIRLLKLGIVFSVFCNLGAIEAMAADLITPVPEGAAARAEAPARQVVAQQLARVDAAGLVAALSATSRVGAAPLVLDLLPGVSVPLVVDRTDPTPSGMAAFAAHSPGDAASSSTVVVNDGTVYAVISYKNATYEIRHLSNGIHRISKINQDRYPGDKVIEGTGPNPPPSGTEGSKSAGVTEAAKAVAGPRAAVASTVISVAIISTLAARTHHPDWLSIAQAAVTDANTTFANSGVALTFTATSIASLNNYDETSKTFDQMLADLSTAPGITSFRDSTRSDLVAIFRDDAGLGNAFCGLGYLPDPPSAATSARAYSIVNIGCAVGNHSYVHEAGHNMGLRHDRYVEGAFGILQAKYNYGFSNVAHRVRTVMAYPDYCLSKGVSCTRVAFLSNPFKTSNGGVLGVNVGSIDPAYNARRLTETKAIIAAYR